MWKYALTISYLGTRYCGWQRQVGSAADGPPSVQDTFDRALRHITGEPEARSVASGRTDSGVHALAQWVHIVLRTREWDPEKLRLGMNSQLPANIRVTLAQRVPIEFHAQRSAVCKQYSYYFQQGTCALPHLKDTTWWILKKLDVPAMSRGLESLVGEHDFGVFKARGGKPGSTVRRILEADVTWSPIPFPGAEALEGFGLVRVRIVGTGFLKQMVRSIAGTLLEIGEGRRRPESVAELLVSGDRQAVGVTAPGRGLWLEKLTYPVHSTN